MPNKRFLGYLWTKCEVNLVHSGEIHGVPRPATSSSCVHTNKAALSIASEGEEGDDGKERERGSVKDEEVRRGWRKEKEGVHRAGFPSNLHVMHSIHISPATSRHVSPSVKQSSKTAHRAPLHLNILSSRCEAYGELGLPAFKISHFHFQANIPSS